MRRRRRLLLVGQTVAQAEAIISGLGPTLWLKLNEGAGQAVVNAANPGTYDGTLGAGAGAGADDPAWQSYGLSFDGGDEVRVPATLATAIGGGNPLTIAAVVQTNSGREFGVQFRQSPTPDTNKRLTLRRVNTGTTLRVEFTGGGHTSALTLGVSSWHFVAYTRSGSNANTSILYLDGASEAANSYSAVLDTQGVFQLGWVDPSGVAMGAGYALVFPSALSADNIALLRTSLATIMRARGVMLP